MHKLTDIMASIAAFALVLLFVSAVPEINSILWHKPLSEVQESFWFWWRVVMASTMVLSAIIALVCSFLPDRKVSPGRFLPPSRRSSVYRY